MQIKKIKFVKFEIYKPSQRSQEKILFLSAKARAKKKGLPFNIKESDIFIPPYCPALGIPLLREGPVSDFSPSLDRIIPRLGYVKGNVVVISLKANRIKNDATVEELEKVLNFYKKVLDK